MRPLVQCAQRFNVPDLPVPYTTPYFQITGLFSFLLNDIENEQEFSQIGIMN